VTLDRSRTDHARYRRRRTVAVVILTLGLAVPGARIAKAFPHKSPAVAEQVIRKEDLR
jgi:hypothetical protein